MKYIMLRHRIGDVFQYLPVIFPEKLVHRDVAMALRRLDKSRGACVVASAGSYSIASGACYGESESLGAKAHPKDKLIIETMDHLHGIGMRDDGDDAGTEATKL